MESLQFWILNLDFLFQPSNYSFDVTILKGFNDFSERPIYGKPCTSGSYRNHYHGKMYMYLYFIIKNV